MCLTLESSQWLISARTVQTQFQQLPQSPDQQPLQRCLCTGLGRWSVVWDVMLDAYAFIAEISFLVKLHPLTPSEEL